jgi:hypothetical protein
MTNNKPSMKNKILKILDKEVLPINDKGNELVAKQIFDLFNISKRYYWLRPDGTISNMWNEDDHKKLLTEEDIKDAQQEGWQLIQINVC